MNRHNKKNWKKARWIFLLITVLVQGAFCPVNAQTDRDPAKVKTFLEKMQQTYRDAAYLGFKVKYSYANAGEPGQSLDSLTGEVELDKGRSRFVIEGTETIMTGKYAIHVVSQDKLIYLSKPSRGGMMDPVGVLDSLLAHLEGMTATVEKEGLFETLTLQFPPGQSYKRVQMTTDPKTGFLQRVEYFLYTAGVVGQEMIDRPGHPGLYQPEGKVVIVFSQYRKNGFGDTLFNEGNFFTRTGDHFEPAGLYKDYHIFLASSNL